VDQLEKIFLQKLSFCALWMLFVHPFIIYTNCDGQHNFYTTLLRKILSIFDLLDGFDGVLALTDPIADVGPSVVSLIKE